MSNETNNMDKKLERKLAEALKGISEKMTDEQKETAKSCETMDELMKFLGREGIELPDELLDDVAGGVGWLGTGVFEYSTPWAWYTSWDYFTTSDFEDDINEALQAGNREKAKESLRKYLDWCREPRKRWMNDTYYWWIIGQYKDLFDEMDYQVRD